MSIRLEKKTLTIVVPLLALATGLVSIWWYDPGAGWPFTVFIAALVVLFITLILWMVSIFALALWRLSTPRSLSFDWTDRLTVRVAKLIGLVFALALVSFVFYRNAPLWRSAWGSLVIIVALACLPTVVNVLRRRVLAFKSPPDWTPRVFEMLVVKATDDSIRENSQSRAWLKKVVSPLERVMASISHISRLCVIYPDFGLYRAFEGSVMTAEESLLVVGPLPALTPKQLRILRERVQHPVSTSLIFDCADNELLESILSDSLSEAEIVEFSPLTERYERQIVQLMVTLEPRHLLIVLSGEDGPVALMAERGFLRQIQERQHSAASRLRQQLRIREPQTAHR